MISCIAKSSPLLTLLLVSSLLVCFLFSGASEAASAASANKVKEASVVSSEGGSSSLSKGDLGRIFQLLADNYKREVSQEEDDLSLRPSSMYLSMLKRAGNTGGSDDYGHLRFGRSGSRIKYNDPDYGHMRFGRK